MFDNMLTSELPATLAMGCGVFYINSGFKTMLAIERNYFETDEPDGVKHAKAIALFYPVGGGKNLFYPSDLGEALQCTFDFKMQKGKRSYKPMQNNEPVTLDFLLDADAIFADFWREYRIDLNVCDLHWYTFLALFRNLSGDASVNAIRHIRSTPVQDVAKDRQSKHLQLQESYAIQSVQDPVEMFNRKLMEECQKSGDYARYNREKRR